MPETINKKITPLELGAFSFYINDYRQIMFHYKYDQFSLADLVRFEGLHAEALKYVKNETEKKWLIANESRWKSDYKDKINEYFQDVNITKKKILFDSSEKTLLEQIYYDIELNNNNITISKLNYEKKIENEVTINCDNLASSIEFYYYLTRNLFLTKIVFNNKQKNIEHSLDFFKEDLKGTLHDGYNLSEIIYNMSLLDN